LRLATEPPAGRSDPNEQILVNGVWREVQGRTIQSLHHTTLRTLGHDGPSRCAQLLWQGQLRLAGVEHPIACGQTTIGDQWDHPALNHRLLIVGPSGIGKTTVLLELAAELIQRANHDPDHPIPVIFHLSSWLSDQHSFEDWLRIELSVKYGVTKRLSHQWLEAKILLPLLDGLDALPPVRQQAACQQLNTWLGNHPGPLVVCCQGEPDDPAMGALALNGTLTLEPLSLGQLEQYLTSLGLHDFWMTVQQWPEWLDLMRVPLWLNLSILARETLDLTDRAQCNDPQTWQNALLDAFIAQQLHRPLATQAEADRSQPTASQTRLWLGWFAQHINAQSEYEFLIENMQPTLLRNRQQIIQYSILGGLFFGLMGGLIFGLFIGPGSGLFVTFVIVSLFIIRRGDHAIDTIDTRPTTTSLMKFIFVRQVNYLLFLPLLISLALLLTGQTVARVIFTFFLALVVILITRLSIALPSWLMGGVVFRVNRFFEADISMRTKPNQGFHEMLLYMLRSAAMFVPVLLLIKITPLFWQGHGTGPIPSAVTSLLPVLGIISAIALWATLFDSALACAQHLALRLVLFQAKAIPWNYARFLNACCDRNLLQRVGGRYRFTHQRLQERFATLP
jgi:DNA polymerase III delta prime subunit